jgi:hypothetical protein
MANTENGVQTPAQDVNTTQNAPQVPEKTFTQADVDRIVAGRVAKYSDYAELKDKAAKYDEVVEANKSELEKAQERANKLQSEVDKLQSDAVRYEVSQATGVPANLLTGATKEDCETQAKAILEFSKPASYPVVPDGGEPKVTTGKSTREQFAEWLETQTK